MYSSLYFKAYTFAKIRKQSLVGRRGGGQSGRPNEIQNLGVLSQMELHAELQVSMPKLKKVHPPAPP